MADVLVVGGGPAGRAVAAACSDVGLRVCLVDPSPRRAWTNTYAAWHDELPVTVARHAAGTITPWMRAVGTSAHQLARPYTVLDNGALGELVSRGDVVEVAGKVASAEHGPSGSTVRLRSGERLAAAVVIDASGSARVLSGGRPPGTPAQQTAVGLVVPAENANGVLGTATGVFMDWRQVPGTGGGWPTFLYAVPLPGGRVLLEETSLARRPGLPLAVLRRRLHERLALAGVGVPDDAVEERVRFPVDDPPPRASRTTRTGVVPFGSAAGMVHPATGFSVAASLRLAPWMASALAAGLATSPTVARRAAWSVLWPKGASAAHDLRRRGLEALLGMPPALIPEFFDLFFSVEQHRQRAFLSTETDFRNTSTAMAALFRHAPWEIRRHLLLSGIPGRRPAARHGFGGATAARES